MTDTPTDAGEDTTLPDETPPDAFNWTEEPGQPDQGGEGAEFVNDVDADGVPGVRRGPNSNKG